MSCACTPILLVEPGESYGKSACLCLGGHHTLWQEKNLFLFWSWKSSAAQLWPDVPMVLVLGLVVFAEVKVPVRTGRKCGLCTCAAVCVAPRE